MLVSSISFAQSAMFKTVKNNTADVSFGKKETPPKKDHGYYVQRQECLGKEHLTDEELRLRKIYGEDLHVKVDADDYHNFYLQGKCGKRIWVGDSVCAY